jgi:hypothetical protein
LTDAQDKIEHRISNYIFWKAVSKTIYDTSGDYRDQGESIDEEIE